MCCAEFGPQLLNEREEDDEDEVSASNADSCSHMFPCHSTSCNERVPVDSIEHEPNCADSNKPVPECRKRACKGQRPLTCTVCKRTFLQNFSLKLHMLTHKWLPPITHTVCSSHKLLEHSGSERDMLAHSKCRSSGHGVCKQKCSRSDSLKTHLRTRRGEAPGVPSNLEHDSARDPSLTCSICSHTFTRSASLRRHLNSGEKLYSCFECGQKFASSYTLSVHLRSHSGERPYTCPVCPGRFTQSASLKRHMLFHSAENPHCCSHCNAKFASAISLKRHVAHVHADQRSAAGDLSKNESSSKQSLCVQRRYRLGADFRLQIQNADSFHQAKE